MTRGSDRGRATRRPLGVLARGLAAGAVGTAAMDVLLFVRYRHDGGQESLAEWEFSSGQRDWEQAPAPAQVGRRLIEGLFQIELAAQRVPLVNNVTHWAFGMLNGAQYGLIVGSFGGSHVSYGLPFGAVVWTSGYVVLPAAKLYEPIWNYDRATLARDLSAHLIYGLATAAAMRVLG
jgi:hypothetical protein